MQIVTNHAGVTIATAIDIKSKQEYYDLIASVACQESQSVHVIIHTDSYHQWAHAHGREIVSTFGVAASEHIRSCNQYASLCQAACATLRSARAGDTILFVATGAEQVFRNKREAQSAFCRLMHYFAAEVGW